MSKTSEIIETDLAPHIDIHDPAIIVGLTKLVAAAREDAAQIADESFYEDEGGMSPMEPHKIAERIRDTAISPKGDPTSEEGLDELMDDLLG